MAKLSTHIPAKTQRAMIFGAPKSGKTQLAGTLAEKFKLIWVDMENGHETLFKLDKAWQDNIELINLHDTPSYPIAIETVLKMLKGKVAICEAHGKVDCMICKRALKSDASLSYESHFIDVDLPNLGSDTVVVFDSLTQLTTSAINHITRKEGDDYKLQTDDWGGLAKLVEIFLATIQQASYNVVVISHEIEAQTEGKKKTLVPVAGSRNSSRNSAKAFDHVIYAERKNKKHVFASGSGYSTTILTGSRSDAVMEGEEGATLLDLFEGKLKASKDVTTSGAKATNLLKGLKTKLGAK